MEGVYRNRLQLSVQVMSVGSLVFCIGQILVGLLGISIERIMGYLGVTRCLENDSFEINATIAACGTVGLFLAILLLIGANKRNRRICLVWYFTSLVHLVVTLILTVHEVSIGDRVINTVGRTLLILFQSVVMWTVGVFMIELNVEAKALADCNNINTV